MDPILLDIPDEIETERLIVRSVWAGDGPELMAAIQDSLPGLKAWMPWATSVPTVEEAEINVRRARIRYLERSDLRVGLFLKDGGRMVGSSGLLRMDWQAGRFEIGYWVRASDAGQGYITEAVRALMTCAFDVLNARRLEIHCDEQNTRSRKVAERVGFMLEARLQDHSLAPSGELRNTLIYARLRP